jgi:hypothetical protein
MTNPGTPASRRPSPKLGLNGHEWKLYLVGLLGTAYAASLLAVVQTAGTVAPSAPLLSTPPAAPTAAPTPPVTLSAAGTRGAGATLPGPGPVVATPPPVPRAQAASSLPRIQAPRILTRTS